MSTFRITQHTGRGAALGGALLLALLASGCELFPPQGVTRDDIANYEVAVASIGCKLVTESDYLPVELQSGLTRQQVLDITAYEITNGNAVELPEGGVQLIKGACA